jgi:hypothetical protein
MTLPGYRKINLEFAKRQPFGIKPRTQTPEPCLLNYLPPSTTTGLNRSGFWHDGQADTREEDLISSL